MSRIALRNFSQSSRSRSSAATACTEILERFGSKPISTRQQLLDANQLQLLHTTLNRPQTSQSSPVDDATLRQGTPVPPGYHLVYFTPSILEQHLGLDGTDQTVNPLSPFTRRMWAGGELEWTQNPSSLLRVGQTVTETTRILSAVPKTLKSGSEMCVVGVEKTFTNDAGIALVDRRNWVFQAALDASSAAPPAPRPNEKAFPDGSLTRDFTQTEVTLFRFSALTFNAHKIHYSKPWCQSVEGHRDCVVHGPLNLINMLDLWRDAARDADEAAVPKSISYRAMSPL
ncbi:hypothetical protein EJ04DRAFT_555539 [Polyplosphaeria fusca]|uniref:Mesaconyl-C(4)-CoA hydratase n=1 Tax=Polyplosphaeria fusca TaxID=682080 RepID=A0A9P4QPI5_9PLEO|nr:hypothetical protein EJ04DRAFT_555539 [Polyplosphaeria fusca]